MNPFSLSQIKAFDDIDVIFHNISRYPYPRKSGLTSILMTLLIPLQWGSMVAQSDLRWHLPFELPLSRIEVFISRQTNNGYFSYDKQTMIIKQGLIHI